MGREVKRVPVGFDWPLNKVWQGYLMPERLHEDKCPDCQNGYSSQAQHLFDLWYGYVPFDPETNGSTPLTPDTPAVRAFAERNVKGSPDFYGTGETAIAREARRLADLWNGQWSHHLNVDDVAALLEADRLWDLTRRIGPNGWEWWPGSTTGVLSGSGNAGGGRGQTGEAVDPQGRQPVGAHSPGVRLLLLG